MKQKPEKLKGSGQAEMADGATDGKSLAAMSLEDFKQRIAGICGPAPKKENLLLVKPGDRGYSKCGPPRESDGGAQ